jgi:hypothetical protein
MEDGGSRIERIDRCQTEDRESKIEDRLTRERSLLAR